MLIPYFGSDCFLRVLVSDYLSQTSLPSLQSFNCILTCFITVSEIFRWVVLNAIMEVIIISEEGMHG
jgi:hypothetical protein